MYSADFPLKRGWLWPLVPWCREGACQSGVGVEKGNLEKLNNWIILAAIDLDLIYMLLVMLLVMLLFFWDWTLGVELICH